MRIFSRNGNFAGRKRNRNAEGWNNDHMFYIFSLQNKLNYGSKITVYKSIIAPHFEYFTTILFLCNQEEIQRMQVLQNRAMRIILKCSKLTSSKWMLDTLMWMTIKQRIDMKTILLIRKNSTRAVTRLFHQHCQLQHKTEKRIQIRPDIGWSKPAMIIEFLKSNIL